MTVRSKPRTLKPSRVINAGLLPSLLGYSLKRAQITFFRDYGRVVGRDTIRVEAFSLLILVDENPGIAQIELAEQLLMDQASIVGLVDGLQRRGWVQRQKCTIDRRRQGIFLTGRGHVALADLRHEILEHEARYAQLYSAEELAQLVNLLGRIHLQARDTVG